MDEEEFKKYLRWLAYGSAIYHLFNTVKQHGANDTDKILAVITDVLRIIN